MNDLNDRIKNAPPMNIVMRATYEEIYPSDPDVDPEIRMGWTDPNNPYGGLKTDTTDLSGADAAKAKSEAETVTFDNVHEAAEFVREFPGGVWNYTDTDASSENYSTGVSTRVTLFVDDDAAPLVFAWADALEKAKLDR